MRHRGYSGKAADVWSSGVVLFATLFCRYPLGASPERSPQHRHIPASPPIAVPRKETDRRCSVSSSDCLHYLHANKQQTASVSMVGQLTPQFKCTASELCFLCNGNWSSSIHTDHCLPAPGEAASQSGLSRQILCKLMASNASFL